MKEIRNAIITFLIVIFASLYVIFTAAFNDNYGGGKAQYLRHLDYQVQVNEDGSMNVIETWDIDVGNTNTLVRNFNLDKSKFGDIANVEIIDLQDGNEFEPIDVEMYHVPEGKFYALQLSASKFEIAFGVGMDSKYENRKFQISYTVTDVVTDYADCQEIYWKFLAQGQNLIPVRKVTGTVTLPEEVQSLDDVFIWGHGQLNGTIEKLNNSQVSFKVNSLSAGAMLEIRVVTKDKIFEVVENKTKGYKNLSRIISEEENWQEEANIKNKRYTIFIYLVYIIYAIIVIRLMIKIVKTLKIQKIDNTKNELKYYRDIPREETATPAEATYLYKFNKTRLSTELVQSNAITATILDLCYKKKISLRMNKSRKVYIKVISDSNGLKKDELEIYKLLTQIAPKGNEFEVEELKTYAYHKYRRYSKIINRFVNYARDSLYKLGLIDKVEERLYSKSFNAKSKMKILGYGYISVAIVCAIIQIPIFKFRIAQYYGIFWVSDIVMILLSLLPLVIISMFYWKLQIKMQDRILVLTPEGMDEQAKWKGLSNYMQEYSLMKEKDVFSLGIWEKYLIYATAFGIADKVINQMKSKYPEVFIQENWNDEEMRQNYPVIQFTLNPINFSNTVFTDNSISSLGKGLTGAYRTSQSQISSHSIERMASSFDSVFGSSSGGSGGGGGFSSGGGGRRRSVDGMSGR